MAAITEEDCRRLKLLRILETAGQRVLTYTLQCGTPGRPSTGTLLDYLDNLPQHSTANYMRERNPSRSFNATDQHQIKGDPTCTSFDLTLLHKAIKLACEDVADLNKKVNNVSVWRSPTPLPGLELEHFVAKIKDTRNAVVHEHKPLSEAAFLNEVTALRDLFDSCLRATKDRYARDDAKYQIERVAVQDMVTDILQDKGMDFLQEIPGMDKEAEVHRKKLSRILETAGQRVLTYTLHCGTPDKPYHVPLLEYLDNLPQHSTANYTNVKDKSKCFNKTDKDQMNGDPMCKNLDVTVLYKTIKLACENMSDFSKMVHNDTPLPDQKLEHYISKISEISSALVHKGQPLSEAAFLKEVAMLRDLFDNCLRATKNRYARDDTEYQAERTAVQVKVTDIVQGTISSERSLQRSAASLLPNFKLETEQELRAKLDSARYLTPLHFLSGIPEDRLEVNDIFCDIILVEETGTAPRGDAHKVPYLEVLRLCEGITTPKSGGSRPSGQVWPQVLVMEGDVGIGKTAWANFLVQQWLEPQAHRRMQGLDRYDLLLRVVCQERSSPTLEGLVQQLLPKSHIRYSRLLLPLLKKCRVLVIIDGIDNMNKVSRLLVDNILSEAATTTFTVVCTSRPHCVQYLKTRICMDFQVSHVRMLGISENRNRMELVVRHYQWLCAGGKTAADTDALRQAVRGIIWREVFSLPLNLLFLAAMLFFEPHKVSSNISMIDLYQHIYTWCREKLQARLAAPSQTGRDRRSRRPTLGSVLDVINEVALKGLLQGRISLSDQDLQNVEDACVTQRLDPNAVLSAYYSMKREVVAGVVRDTYMAPQKSLQGFMAAKCIARHVKQNTEGTIECVLRRYTAGQDPPLRHLQPTLVQLLSLLTGQCDGMKETVDLLYRSGVTRTGEWLDVLTDAMAPDAVVQHVVEQLVAGGLHDEKEIKVNDECVRVASTMLRHLPPQKVEVQLEREHVDIDNLALVLAHHQVTKVTLQGHWRHPQQHAASATLLQRLPRSDLQRFRGQLDAADLKLLPPCLESLDLAVRDSSHAQTLLPALAEIGRSFPCLGIINLHINAAAVTAESVTRLPPRPDLRLYLSGVTDELMAAAVDIVAAVCPPEQGFLDLFFPEATLELTGWEDLFTRLQQAGVRVRDTVYVPDTHISEEERIKFNTLALTMLGCEEMSRLNNEDIWRK